ncbi:MAG: MarP family serine protease [Actinomycetota bacterium]
MSVLDLFIGVFVLLVVLRGVRTGFLAGAFSLAGAVVGASLGSRLAPALLPEEGNPLYGAGITLASIVAFALLGEVLARTVGGALRRRLPGSRTQALDGLAGGLLGLALSLTLVWVVGIFALQSPVLSGIHPAVERSRILAELNERMPSELLTEAVSKLDPIPQIKGPNAEVADPSEGIAGDPEVLAAASRTVRVSGIACGYGVEGSGWVAAPNLVVTNAHVVAGETVTHVQPEGAGPHRRARVVVFDARNDIAVLRVRNLGLAPLPMAQPEFGEPAAVLGFPENGPLKLQPARTGSTRRVISSDAYNRGPVERIVTSFRGHVRPGNSGGPVVNADGEVVATIFASRADSSDSGYGVPSQIVSRHVERAAERKAPVSTGECAN